MIVTFPRNDEADTFWAAANYLAILAYPEDRKQRENFCNACRAWWIKGESGKIRGKGIYKKEIRAYVRDEKIMNTIQKAWEKIIEKRAVAAEIKFENLIRTIGQNKKAAIGAKLLEHKRRQGYKNEAKTLKDNAYNRIWSSSQPVLHLHFGLHNALVDKGLEPANIFDILAAPDWVWNAVDLAEQAYKGLSLIENPPADAIRINAVV